MVCELAQCSTQSRGGLLNWLLELELSRGGASMGINSVGHVGTVTGNLLWPGTASRGVFSLVGTRLENLFLHLKCGPQIV